MGIVVLAVLFAGILGVSYAQEPLKATGWETEGEDAPTSPPETPSRGPPSLKGMRLSRPTDAVPVPSSAAPEVPDAVAVPQCHEVHAVNLVRRPGASRRSLTPST
jgi:hypothetical protein